MLQNKITPKKYLELFNKAKTNNSKESIQDKKMINLLVLWIS